MIPMGRGLAVGYLAAGVLLWALPAGLSSLAVWVGPRFLIYTPLVPIALPIVFVAGRSPIASPPRRRSMSIPTRSSRSAGALPDSRRRTR